VPELPRVKNWLALALLDAEVHCEANYDEDIIACARRSG
jgi:hypothetical protein